MYDGRRSNVRGAGRELRHGRVLLRGEVPAGTGNPAVQHRSGSFCGLRYMRDVHLGGEQSHGRMEARERGRLAAERAECAGIPDAGVVAREGSGSGAIEARQRCRSPAATWILRTRFLTVPDAPVATSAALESAMSSTICRHDMSGVHGSGAGDEVGGIDWWGRGNRRQ